MIEIDHDYIDESVDAREAAMEYIDQLTHLANQTPLVQRLVSELEERYLS